MPCSSSDIWKAHKEAPSHVGLGTLTQPRLLSLHPSSSLPFPPDRASSPSTPAEVKTDPIDRPVHRGIDADGPLLVRKWRKTDDREGAEKGIWRGPLKCQERRYIGLLCFLSCPVFQLSAWFVSEWKDDSQRGEWDGRAPQHGIILIKRIT